MDAATATTLGVGVVLSVIGWFIIRTVNHVDARSERMEHKHDALVEKLDEKFDNIHGRVTGVETGLARLAGEWDARKTDSKGNLKSYPK
jgi:hypothetical protein